MGGRARCWGEFFVLGELLDDMQSLVEMGNQPVAGNRPPFKCRSGPKIAPPAGFGGFCMRQHGYIYIYIFFFQTTREGGRIMETPQKKHQGSDKTNSHVPIDDI